MIISATKAKNVLAKLMRDYYLKKQEPFRLNCGAVSSHYFDLKAGQMCSDFMHHICEMTLSAMPFVNGIAGMESGAFPYVGAILAMVGSKRYLRWDEYTMHGLMVRKKPKGHGTNTQVEGLRNLSQPYKDYNIWVLEDVTTTGGSALQVAMILRELDFNVVGVTSILDRQEVLPIELESTVRESFAAKGLQFGEWPTGPFAQAVFQQFGLKFKPLLTMEEFLEINGLAA